jgi:hypothetical protein
MIDIRECLHMSEIAESAEDAWLNQLADEAESEGMEGSVSRGDGRRAARSSGLISWGTPRASCRMPCAVRVVEDGQLIVRVLATD